MHMIEKFCCLIIWPLSKVLPVDSIPELAIVLVFICIFFMVEFIVMVMNVFSAYTGISHFIVGITLMVWGSDNMEMLNLAVSTAKGYEELGLTAVLSC
jgi:Ca2+/Na+ antiporter